MKQLEVAMTRSTPPLHTNKSHKLLVLVIWEFDSIFISIATISQKDSGTNFLPPLINVAGCQNMCSFLFFLFPCFFKIDLGGRGDLKSLPLILWKLFLVVPPYFLTDCSLIFGKKIIENFFLVFKNICMYCVIKLQNNCKSRQVNHKRPR